MNKGVDQKSQQQHHCEIHSQQIFTSICPIASCPQLGPLCVDCKNIHSQKHSFYPLDQYIHDQSTANKLGRVLPTNEQIKNTQISILEVFDDFQRRVITKVTNMKESLEKQFTQILSDANFQNKGETRRIQLVQDLYDNVIPTESYKMSLQEVILSWENLCNQKRIFTNYALITQSINTNLQNILKQIDQVVVFEFRNENLDDSVIESNRTHQTPMDSTFMSIKSQNQLTAINSSVMRTSQIQNSPNKIKQTNLSTVGQYSSISQEVSQDIINGQKSSIVRLETHQNGQENTTQKQLTLQIIKKPIQETQPIQDYQQQQNQIEQEIISNNAFDTYAHNNQTQKEFMKQTPSKGMEESVVMESYIQYDQKNKKQEKMGQQPQLRQTFNQTQTVILKSDDPQNFPTFNGASDDQYMSFQNGGTFQTQQQLPKEPDITPRSEISHVKKSQMQSSMIINVPSVKRTQFPVGFQPIAHQKVNQFRAHDKAVKCLLLLHNKNILVSSSSEDTVKVWKRDDFVLLQSLQGHSNNLLCIEKSSDENIVASGSMDKTIILWVWDEKQKNFKKGFQLEGHMDKVRCLRFFQDSLASGGDDTEIIIWSITTGKLIRRLQDINQGRISALWSSSKLQRFLLKTYQDIHLIVGCNKNILIYPLKDYKDPKLLVAHDNLVVSLQILEPDAEQQLQKIQQSVMKFQKTDVNKSQGFTNMQYRNRASLLGGPMDERVLVSGGKDLKIKLWNYTNYQLLYTINEDYIPISILHLQKRNQLLVGLIGFEREGKIIIWNINDTNQAFVCGEICGSGIGVNTLDLHEDNNQVLIYAGYENKRIEVYKLVQ